MALLLQDIFDGFALGKSRARLDAVAAWVSLEDGDIAVGISRMSADLVAVDYDAKDGVLNGNSDRLPLVTAS
ncbi:MULTISPECIES: hypothetical protein, partial [Mycobacterium]|uniref:hypothetical protein n=1 Tax=Mycobacterium TaxID=1763 RepID=UPI001ABF8E0C